MKKLNKCLLAAVVAATGALSVDAMAADKGLYVVPTVGYMNFDSEKSFTGSLGYEDDVTYGLGVGYQFNKNFAVELKGDYAESDYKAAAPGDWSTKFARLHADALYSPFGKVGAFEPYLVVGIGEQEVNPENAAPAPAFNSYDETQIDTGVGTHIPITDTLKARFDVRAHHSLDNEETDASANLGLNWMVWPAAAAVAPVVTPPVCPDGDKDGVCGSADKCPNTMAGAVVDANGCHHELTKTKSFTMRVNFATDSAAVTPASMSEVAELAAFMKQYPKSPVVLEGHTDSRGSAAYNQTLSEKRAAAVAQALVTNFGINPARISTVGYGETRPVATNSTAAGRAENRRTVGNVQATVKVK